MSAVQPVAVYALRVPPGVMVPAVPKAAASVSTTLHYTMKLLPDFAIPVPCEHGCHRSR